MQIERLIHVNINCSNLERSVDFYTRILGGRVVDRSEKEQSEFCERMGYSGETGHRAAFIAFSKQKGFPVIDLLEWNAPGSGRPLDMQDVGIPRIAIGVDDVDAAHAELVAAGVEVLGEPTDLGVGRAKIRAILLRDPDGTLLELVQSI